MPAPTPHNSARPGDFAKTVLMPGDPLRSKFIAENFLTNPRLVNDVRGAQGYTGTWKGIPVSVMSSGMGIPSSSIHALELYNFYGVENIIRIGSAGGIKDEVELRDLVVAQAACTDSNYMSVFGLPGTFAPIADFTLMSEAIRIATEKGIPLKVGNVLSSDHFYYPDGFNPAEKWKKMGVLAAEMEAAGLYANAAYAGKRALCICTITDHLFRPEQLDHDQRRIGLRQMIEIALDVAVAMDRK